MATVKLKLERTESTLERLVTEREKGVEVRTGVDAVGNGGSGEGGGGGGLGGVGGGGLGGDGGGRGGGRGGGGRGGCGGLGSRLHVVEKICCGHVIAVGLVQHGARVMPNALDGLLSSVVLTAPHRPPRSWPRLTIWNERTALL